MPECAVHEVSMKRVDDLTENITTLQKRINDIDKTLATVLERIDWIKALVWLVAASLISGIISIILQLSTK